VPDEGRPSPSGEQTTRAVEVLQRLLTDPDFRRTFRRDPSTACLAAGLDEAAAEFSGAGAAAQTLEIRESKSSLAGLLMAAAAEGAAVYQFAEHMRTNLGGDVADIARQALDKAGVQHAPGGHAAGAHVAEGLVGGQAPAPAAAPAIGAAPGVMADAAAAVDHAQLDAGQHVVHIASKYIGTPYVWGGESPSGFDCSGLVQYCFKQIGVNLERTTWDQVKEGHAVPWGQFKPGDLIFSNFEGPGAGATHVVIYAGHGQVIAAPHTGGHVEYESVDVFKPYFMGARRVVPDAPAGIGIPAVAPAGAHPAPASGTLGMSAVAGSPGSAPPAPSPNAAGVHSTIGSIATPGGAADAVHGVGAGALDSIIGAYPGDHAPRSAIAAWMGDAAQRAGLPRELPVMAALVESGLKNDNYGDRDSLGFFQMRTSIWDHGKYAGFPKDPRLQLRWFIDEAQSLKATRLHEGLSGFGHDPHAFGDWIADIERPAAQYRGRYQLQLEAARQLLRM
jgi:cell wall-associated NlpC family hydrolase